MRDLTKRGGAAESCSPAHGVAFEISDLALASEWAASYDFGMVVRLDHGATIGEDYEEVIAFQTRTSPLYRLILWRNADAVFVQPIVGRVKRYDSVVEALASVLPKPCVTLTDIKPRTWPPPVQPD